MFLIMGNAGFISATVVTLVIPQFRILRQLSANFCGSPGFRGPVLTSSLFQSDPTAQTTLKELAAVAAQQ